MPSVQELASFSDSQISVGCGSLIDVKHLECSCGKCIPSFGMPGGLGAYDDELQSMDLFTSANARHCILVTRYDSCVFNLLERLRK